MSAQRAGLLDALYRVVALLARQHAITEAVAREIGHHASSEALRLGWQQLPEPSDEDYPKRIASLLERLGGPRGGGLGESTVIDYAELDGEYVAVLDDRDARRVAEMRGIRYTGVLGLIGRAHDRGVPVEGLVRDMLEAGARWPREIAEEGFPSWWSRHRRSI